MTPDDRQAIVRWPQLREPMMPRRPRLLLPGVPLHITQRGVNRGATFIDADDHRLYRALLAEVAQSHGIDAHAFVMMSNHVHLLVTPEQIASLAYAMRILNQNKKGDGGLSV
jgi:putative transposase